MSNQAPFRPFVEGQFTPIEQPPQRAIVPRNGARPIVGQCAHCNGAIHQGDKVQDCFPGLADVSDQSQQLIAVPDPELKPQNHIVHEDCAIEYSIDLNPDRSDEILGEMAMEMADSQMSEYLLGWGITSWGELTKVLKGAGYSNPDEESYMEHAESDERLKDRVDGDG